jgi:hypothetical protein
MITYEPLASGDLAVEDILLSYMSTFLLLLVVLVLVLVLPLPHAPPTDDNSLEHVIQAHALDSSTILFGQPLD